MRKFCSLITLFLFTVKAQGAHNLLINGSSSATVFATDSFELSTDFEQPGAIANGVIYLDANDNGQLDPTDPWLYKIKLIDGNFDDEDETANTYYRQIYEPFKFSGKFLFYAEDNAVADTALLTVNSVSSPHSISGTLTNPTNQANILVCLIDIIDPTTLKFEYAYGNFTDNTGYYSIGVPDEYANRWWNIAAIDPGAILPYYGSNDPIDDSIFISGNVTKDIEMRYCPPETTVVYGVLKDNVGNAITEPTIINGGAYVETIGRILKVAKTDNNGAFRVHFPRQTGNFRAWAYIVSAGTATQFYPELLNAPQQQESSFNPSPVLINLNLTAYRTDTTISGYVYKDGNPYDRCEVDCGSAIGGNYTKTYSDGHYVMPVCKLTSQYTVSVATKNIPAGYAAVPEDTIVAPGTTEVNFTLIYVGAEQTPDGRDTPWRVQLYPNPFVSETIFELSDLHNVGNLLIYDITGKYVAELKPATNDGVTQFVLSRKLPAGIYFYSLRVGERSFKGKIVKLQ